MIKEVPYFVEVDKGFYRLQAWGVEMDMHAPLVDYKVTKDGQIFLYFDEDTKHPRRKRYFGHSYSIHPQIGRAHV